MKPRPINNLRTAGNRHRTARRGDRRSRAAASPKARKGSAVFEVKVADLHEDPELAPVPTMRGLLESLQSLKREKAGASAAELKKRIEDHEQRWNGFLSSVTRAGVKEPVQIAKRAEGGYWLRDGRNRVDAATLAGHKTVRAVITTESARDISLRTTAHRRDVSKGCIAFMAIERYPHLLDNAKTGPKGEENWHTNVLTLDEVAGQVGVSTTLLDQAIKLAKHFRDDPKSAKQLRPKVYAGFGLGALLAGIGAMESTDCNGGKRLAPDEHLGSEILRWSKQVGKYWPKIEALTKTQAARVKKIFQLAIAKLPDESIEYVEHALKHRAELIAEEEARLAALVAKHQAAKGEDE